MREREKKIRILGEEYKKWARKIRGVRGKDL